MRIWLEKYPALKDKISEKSSSNNNDNNNNLCNRMEMV